VCEVRGTQKQRTWQTDQRELALPGARAAAAQTASNGQGPQPQQSNGEERRVVAGSTGLRWESKYIDFLFRACLHFLSIICLICGKKRTEILIILVGDMDLHEATLQQTGPRCCLPASSTMHRSS